MSNRYLRPQDLTGKDVIDSRAMKVGRVKDIAFDISGKNALVVETKEMSETVIQANLIAYIGDVILLKPEEAPKQEDVAAHRLPWENSRAPHASPSTRCLQSSVAAAV